MENLLKSKGYKPRTGTVKKCLICGKDFYVSPSRKKQLCCCKEHSIELMKSKGFSFKCVICGKDVTTQPAQIKLRNRKTCSMVCRSSYARKEAEKRRSENGYTKHQLDRLARYSPEASKWRESVFKRDNWTCVCCDIRGGKLEADHIKPWAYFPELRFEISNGRTLCRKCHDKTKLSAKAMQKIYL